MSGPSKADELLRWQGGQATTAPDWLAVEEPLEVHVGDEPFTVTMRTPGDDFSLVAGLLFSEGVIRCASDVVVMAHCASGSDTAWANRVKVQLAEGMAPALAAARNLISSTSCGLCGKAAIDQLAMQFAPLDDGLVINPEVIYRLPETLRAHQQGFDRTGGLHAAALFTATGKLELFAEDVGRHNAVDKVIGQGLWAGTPAFESQVLVVSGRLSYEIVQKALVARIPVVAAVSAPSTLAVDLARAFNLTLVGFLRGNGMNVYSGGARIGRALYPVMQASE
jgi:FdhD protein